MDLIGTNKVGIVWGSVSLWSVLRAGKEGSIENLALLLISVDFCDLIVMSEFESQGFLQPCCQ